MRQSDGPSARNGVTRTEEPTPRRLDTELALPAKRNATWLGRLLGRRQPSTYQRCLAVHMHFAGPHSALY